MKPVLLTMALASLCACTSVPITEEDRAHMREVERRTQSGVAITPARSNGNKPSRGPDKR
jgi:hypothetical protein